MPSSARPSSRSPRRRTCSAAPHRSFTCRARLCLDLYRAWHADAAWAWRLRRRLAACTTDGGAAGSGRVCRVAAVSLAGGASPELVALRAFLHEVLAKEAPKHERPAQLRLDGVVADASPAWAGICDALGLRFITAVRSRACCSAGVLIVLVVAIVVKHLSFRTVCCAGLHRATVQVAGRPAPGEAAATRVAEKRNTVAAEGAPSHRALSTHKTAPHPPDRRRRCATLTLLFSCYSLADHPPHPLLLPTVMRCLLPPAVLGPPPLSFTPGAMLLCVDKEAPPPCLGGVRHVVGREAMTRVDVYQLPGTQGQEGLAVAAAMLNDRHVTAGLEGGGQRDAPVEGPG